MNTIQEEDWLEREFPGHSKMARRMRAFDWVQTALGPVKQWPQSLRTTLGIMLNSRHPMLIWWGREFIQFYNDSYAEMMLGARHPWALGRRAQEVLGAAWDDIGARIESVLRTGESSGDEELPLILERHGYPEETFHSLSYTPIPDEQGEVGGILCLLIEQTRQVLNRRRQQMLNALASGMARSSGSAEQACRAAADILGTNRLDIPFALLYLLDGKTKSARLCGITGLPEGIPATPACLDVDTLVIPRGWPLGKVMLTARPEVVTRLERRFGALPGGAWPEPPHSAVVLPLRKSGQQSVSACLVAGLSPRLELDENYLHFFELTASHLAGAISGASREEQRRANALAELERRMQRQAEGAQRTLHTLLEHVPVAITMTGGPPDFPIIANSKIALELLGKSSAATTGMPAGEHAAAYGLYFADAATMPRREQLPLYRATHLGEVIHDEEWIIKRPDGECRAVLASVAPIRDSEGAIIGAISCWRDITESKRIEESLRRSETQLALELGTMSRLHDLGTRLLASADLQSALREVLDAALAMLGAEMGGIQLYNRHSRTLEIVAQRGFCQQFLDYFPALAADEGSTCARAMRSRQRLIVEDVMADAQYARHCAMAEIAGYRGVQSTPLISRDGSLLGVLSTYFRQAHSPSERELRMLDLYASQAIDLIERMRTEEALRDSEVKFRTLAEASPALIWQLDPDGRAVYLNPRFYDWLRRAPDEVMGEGWHKMLHPDDAGAYLAVVADAQRERLRLQHRVRVGAADGSWHWVESHALPLHDADGKYAGHVGISVDITEAVLAEQALRQADRRKDEFIATLAHELRNPLAPIRNAMTLLRHGAEGSEADRLQQVIERQVDHMVRLVDDLMEVSRISTGKIELRKAPVHLAEVLRSAVETSKPHIDKAGHQLSISLPPEALMLDADAVRLAQVFANLLNNAAKYTDDGGRITLEAQRAGSEAVVSICDNGIGISAHMLPHVFDMFAQTKDSAGRWQGGIGIGLNLVRRLAEMHGGSVEAHSAGPGAGSRFIVRLPLAAAGVSGTGVESDNREKMLQTPIPRRRILVVDDNRDAAESLAMLLEHLGAEVQVGHDGAEALHMMETCKPDVVLLDIGLPGMDGYDVARRIRQQTQYQDVQVIALSGWGLEEDRRRSRESGFDCHLVKPVDLAVLQSLLTESLPRMR